MAEFQLGSLSNTPTVSNNFVGNSDRSDTYSFTLTDTSDLNLSLTRMSADADLRVYRDTNNNGVIDSSDTFVANSTLGGSLNDSINLASQAAGNYLAEVYQYSGNTSYTLRLSTADPSNTIAFEENIGNLNGTRNFSGWIDDSDTSDIYRFKLTEGRNFSLSLTGLSADADVRLVSDFNGNGIIEPNDVYAGGEVLAVSRFGGSTDESINQYLSEGIYFVQVYQYDAANTSYNLSMTA